MPGWHYPDRIPTSSQAPCEDVWDGFLASSVWNKHYLINTNSEIHGKCIWMIAVEKHPPNRLVRSLSYSWALPFYEKMPFICKQSPPTPPCPFTDFFSIVYLWQVTAFLHGTKEELLSFTTSALCFTRKYQQGKWKIMGFVILFILGTLISFQRKVSFPGGTNPIHSQQHLSFTFLQSSNTLSNRIIPLFLPLLLPTWHLTFPVALRMSCMKEQDLGCHLLQFSSINRNFFALLDLLLSFLVLCGVNNYRPTTFTFLPWRGGKRPQAPYAIYYTMLLIV